MTMQHTNKFEGIGFRVSIKRLPEVEFLCRSVNIPSISSTPYNRPSPIKGIPEQGDAIVYAPLDLTFFVDDNMNNYKDIYDWIHAYTTPDQLSDYKTLSKTQQTGLLESDISVGLLTSKHNEFRTFTFTDAFPTDLSSINIEADGSEVPIMLCTATFQYTSFNIE